MCVGGPAWGGGGVACVGGPPPAGIVDYHRGDCWLARQGVGCHPVPGSGPVGAVTSPGRDVGTPGSDATGRDRVGPGTRPGRHPGRGRTSGPDPTGTDRKAPPRVVAFRGRRCQNGGDGSGGRVRRVGGF